MFIQLVESCVFSQQIRSHSSRYACSPGGLQQGGAAAGGVHEPGAGGPDAAAGGRSLPLLEAARAPRLGAGPPQQQPAGLHAPAGGKPACQERELQRHHACRAAQLEDITEHLSN